MVYVDYPPFSCSCSFGLVFSKLTAPPPPAPGSTIAIVSPSFPAVAEWPHRVENGVAYLRSLGFEVKIMPNAGLSTGWTAGTGEQRADDINQAFADPEVSVVLAAIGGNHSAQLLPHLDFELIGSNPKVFQGYSDITVLHWALLKNAHVQTFYGPALVSELGEHPQVLPYTDRWLRAAWLHSEPLAFEPAEEWTDEFLDWDEKRDLERPRTLHKGNGWVCIRPGRAEGPLLGGCLETIAWHVRGTDIWIDPGGAVLFLETSEESPSPAHVDGYLTTLERDGVLDRIAGLVIGRPYGYDEESKKALFEVITRHTESAGIPVLADVDLGHTDPMLTLPLGATATLDAAGLGFSIER